MSRKDRLLRNLGGTTAATDERFTEPYFKDAPPRAEVSTSMVLVERLFRQVLSDEVERLRQDVEELRRFFSHFFDPTVGSEERETFVQDFIQNPPRVVLGYPRTTASWPMFSIIMSNEAESDTAIVGKYVGTTQPGESPHGREDQEFEGAFWDVTYTVMCLATHPDQCAYLYQFAKLVLFGAKEALETAGVIDPHYSGGELNPEEMLLPDIAFVRALTIKCTTMMTIPKVLTYRDGRKLRVAGLFLGDSVVDGLAGGVTTVPEVPEVPGKDGTSDLILTDGGDLFTTDSDEVILTDD